MNQQICLGSYVMFSFFSCFKTQPAETYCSTMLFFHVFPLQGSILGEGVHVFFFWWGKSVGPPESTLQLAIYMFFLITHLRIYITKAS